MGSELIIIVLESPKSFFELLSFYMDRIEIGEVLFAEVYDQGWSVTLSEVFHVHSKLLFLLTQLKCSVSRLAS